MSDDTAHSSPEHHAKTLLRGGRPLPPRLLYIGMQSLDALLFSIAYTIYGLYAVKAATLGALELTLVGTIMELTVFLTEVPTGMVADLYSRRLSVILGLCISGTGIALLGVVPTFWRIALGSVLWGVGGTFISGAHQAWLADEIGEVQAAPVYLRATQLSQVGGLVGIPLSVALASIQLQLPLWVSGAGFWGLAGLLLLTMPEQGYRPVAPAPLHLLATIGLSSSFAEATWFGILQAGALLGGAVVTWGISQTTALHNPQRIVQILLAFTVVMLLATLLFALAGVFWLGLIAVWMTRWIRIATRPLVVAWANRGFAPGARATVLSMLSQAEALGEVCGGPLLGLVGTLHTVRTALVGAAMVLLPTLPLYGQVLRHSKQEAWPAP